MATQAELADQISQLDLRIKNVRSAIAELRTDIQHPHIMQKQLAELRAQITAQGEKLSQLQRSERYCLNRLDSATAASRLDALQMELFSFNRTREKLFTEFETVKGSATALKSFDKLTKGLSPDDLKQLLQSTLAAMRGASNADVPPIH